jgi:hypothetical protein
MAHSSYSEVVGGDHITITYLSALNELMMAAYNVNDSGEVVREDFVKFKGSDQLYTFLQRTAWKMSENGAQLIPGFTDNEEVVFSGDLPVAKEPVKPEPIEVENIGVF